MEASLCDLKDKKVKVVYFLNVPENFCPYIKAEEGGVKEIKYHTPLGEGDRHFVDVYYEDGQCSRLFNIDFIKFA